MNVMLIVKYYSTVMQGKRKLYESHTRFFSVNTALKKIYIKFFGTQETHPHVKINFKINCPVYLICFLRGYMRHNVNSLLMPVRIQDDF